MSKRSGRLAAIATTIAITAAGIVGPAGAAAAEGGFPPRDERCKVPPVLLQVAAIIDVDSLEGCGFFEDPNFFENRKAAGLYNPNGLFSTIFG